MLERSLGVVVDQATGHDQVLRDPLAVVALERAELTEGPPVELAPGHIRVDLRRPLAVRAVRDAQVAGVVRAGTLLACLGPLVAVEAAGAPVVALERTTLPAVVTLERTTLPAVVTLGTVTERTTLPAVVSPALSAITTAGLPIIAVAVGAALPELIVTVTIPESARPAAGVAGAAERAASPFRAAAAA
jgi:hypothetical protein